MPWVKIDDQFYVHENRWEVGLEGIGFFIVMLCYCNDKLTDGFVTKAFVEANMPRPDRRGTLKKLVSTGMIAEAEGGFQIVGYHKFQPTKEQVLRVREDRSAAGKKGAAARWGDGKLPSKPHGKRAA